MAPTNGIMNPAPFKDPPFMHDAEEGALFSPIKPLRFREEKGTEKTIVHSRQSMCVTRLDPRCIPLIGRLRGVSP